MNRVSFLNQTFHLPAYVISDFQMFLDFYLQAISVEVLWYPTITELKSVDISKSNILVVLGTQQLEEQAYVRRTIPPIQVYYSPKDVYEFLGLPMGEEYCLSTAKNKSAYKALYVFSKLFVKYNWNPAWIKNMFSRKELYWVDFAFMDSALLAKDFLSVKKYISIVAKPSPYILIQLLFSELTGERTISFDFFTTLPRGKKTFSKNELQEFNIEALIKEGALYSPKKEEYEVVQ